jgi:hypothetical protein
MKNKILLTLVLLIPSLCFGKEFVGLKDKNYKYLRLIVKDIGKSNTGITKDAIQTELQLLVLNNGIKPSKKGKDSFLWVNVNIIPLDDKKHDVFSIQVEYVKYPLDGFKQHTGYSYTPEQGDYSQFGITGEKREIISYLQIELKKFLVDYLESNI